MDLPGFSDPAACVVCRKPIDGDPAALSGYDTTPVHRGTCFATYRRMQDQLALSQIRGGILAEIDRERVRQDAKWGRIAGDWPKFWQVMMEEIGEVATAELESEGPARVAAELIQVAAVAVKRLEAMGVTFGG